MKANGRRRAWVGRTALLGVLAAGTLWLAGGPASSGLADDKGEAPAKAAAGLDFVPADGAAVFSVRFADLWDHAAFQSARERLMKDVPEVVEHFTKELGVGPNEIERVTGLLPSAESHGELLFFVTTTRAYDAGKVLAAVAPKAGEETVKDRTPYGRSAGGAIAFLDERTFVVGPEAEVRAYLKQREPAKEGPLEAALREAAGKHLLVAGLDSELLAKAATAEPSNELSALLPMLKARTALLTVDLDDEAKAEARLTFAGESDAEAGERAVNDGLDLARYGMVREIQEAKRQHGMARVVALLEDLQRGLRAAKVDRKGSAVQASMRIKIDADKMGPDLIDAVQKARAASRRMTSINNLKQLALAMYNYHDANGHFPADAIYDKAGKPLLSWRVAILPYIEQDALYKQFHLDEPWDSDHNKKLLAQMPALYGFGDEAAAKDHETHYQGFVGKGAFFDGKKGLKVTDITDGTSNTIMLVEAKKAVPWTKPEDVPFDAGKLVPKLGGLFDGIFNAAMCDGSVHSFPLTISEEKLRALVTINGGEVVDVNK